MKKKLLKRVTTLALAAIMALGVTACAKNNWKGDVALTSPGQVVDNGGFVVDTENYYYFINGRENYTADNTLGLPIKGALMVAAKNDLANAKTVVPKVISSGDYTAGIYVYGTRLYYATPSTKKDTNGNVANDHIEFWSSDFKGNDRTEYLTINGNSTQFRFAEKDGKVYIVYYDSDEAALMSYDTSAKTSTKVAENIAASTFVSNEGMAKTGAVVFYTVTGKNEATGSNAQYNELYVYYAGAAEGTLLASGAGALPQEKTYAITLVDGLNVFYTETPTGGTAKYYAADIAAFVGSDYLKSARTACAESTLIVATTLFDGVDTAYAVDGDFIVKYTDYVASGLNKKEIVAKVTANNLLFISGGNLYYVNGSSEIARISLGDAEAEEVRVSTGAVATDWYDIKLIDDKVFYLDTSDDGQSYVHYADTKAQVIEEDTDGDDEGEIDLRYLDEDSVKLLGVMTEDDTVTIVNNRLSALSTSYAKIVYDDEKAVWEAEEDITEARKAYEALGKLKDKVSESAYNTLVNYERYLEVSKLLKEIVDNEDVEITAANKADWQAKIDAVKAKIKEYEWSSPNTYLIENGMWAMQEMQEKIDDLNEETK